MKNNKIFKCIIKCFWMYVLSLVFLYLLQYINSLTGLFIGEALGVLNNDEHILPEFLLKYMDFSSTKNSLISLSFIYVVISSIGIICNIFTRSLRVSYCQRLYVHLSEEYYKHVLDIPKSEYSKRSTGDIIQRNIEDCKRVTDIFRNSLFEVVKILFVAGTLFLQLYLLSELIFTISIVAFIVCVIFSVYYGYYKIKPKELESSKYYSELNSTIQQSVTNYSLVKSFANEDYEYDKFKKINDKKEKNNYYINNLHCKYWLISDTITSVYVIICYALCAYLFFNNKMSLAAVSAIVIICSKVLEGSTQLVNHITIFVRTFISIKRLREYFNINSEYVEDGFLENDIKGNIEFSNVCMKYEKDYVLKNISFTLKEGETLGIVGKSGSGKTSIVNLLTRLDDYEKGSIKIDGIELKDYKKKHIRENMGVVLQDSYIFSKTIKENLLVLMDNDRVDLDMYLKRVSLDEDINKFESGLETIVGERGVTLSGGQRQRISLLRTMIKNKKILILDDTLSAVDNIVAKKIKESINKEKATTIIISHNLLNIKDADKIIVLDEGEIVDIGTHDELIQREGFYSNVWHLQQMIEEVAI